MEIPKVVSRAASRWRGSATMTGTGETAPAGDRRSSLATLPGIALALLPKVTCPACWPAYAGAFTSLGLGFLLDVRWLFPATAAFLVIAVAALGFRARRRRGFGPFFLGLGAAALVLGGKFGLGIDSATYAGLPLLVGASIWNTKAPSR
jgi:mercuric ion transport protein